MSVSTEVIETSNCGLGMYELRGTVILYTTTDSKECSIAKSELTSMNIPYIEICLDIFPQCQLDMERLAGTNETPQIFFNEVCIGGLEGLQQLANDDSKLDALMEMIRTTDCPSDGPSLPLPEVSDDSGEENNEDNKRENENDQSVEELPLNNPEYAILINSMRKANIIKDNLVGTKKLCRNSFKGEDFIKWIMSERKLRFRVVENCHHLKGIIRSGRELLTSDSNDIISVGRRKTGNNTRITDKGIMQKLVKLERSEAIDLGQKLVSQENKLRRVKNTDENFHPDQFYKVSEIEELKALNQGPTTSETISPDAMNRLLIQLLTPLYEQILSDNNRTVNYACLQDNEHFQRYLSHCNVLQQVAITEETDRNLRMALFLNIYNIMLIHIHYKFGHPSNIWQRRKLMWSTYYLIDRRLYSLQSILNGILRGNRKSYGMLWKPFGKKDFRRKLAVKDPDPSVLFAVASASKSTTPIRLYTAEARTTFPETINLKEELKEAAGKALASDEILMIDNQKKTVALSVLFDWYANDFGSTHEHIIRWILRNMMRSTKKENLQRLINSKVYSVDYLDFDWTPNTKKFIQSS